MFKKKYKKNEYINASGVWVRNFTIDSSTPLDINHLIRSEDFNTVLTNEIYNNNTKIYSLEKEDCIFEKVIIVSDGYKFAENMDCLESLPSDVSVFATNGTLNYWDLKKIKKPINFYIINNPYEEALNFLPRKHKYYPACLASTRTNHKFCKQYNGAIYKYYPTNQEDFGNLKTDIPWYLDDYRSAVCAAITAAYAFNARKILLFHCEDALSEERPYTKKVEFNGETYYLYPQQMLLHDIIEANLYWIKNNSEREISLGYCGYGLEYFNAAYIEKKDIVNFFEDKDE